MRHESAPQHEQRIQGPDFEERNPRIVRERLSSSDLQRGSVLALVALHPPFLQVPAPWPYSDGLVKTEGIYSSPLRIRYAPSPGRNAQGKSGLSNCPALGCPVGLAEASSLLRQLCPTRQPLSPS